MAVNLPLRLNKFILSRLVTHVLQRKRYIVVKCPGFCKVYFADLVQLLPTHTCKLGLNSVSSLISDNQIFVYRLYRSGCRPDWQKNRIEKPRPFDAISVWSYRDQFHSNKLQNAGRGSLIFGCSYFCFEGYTTVQCLKNMKILYGI